MIIKNDQVISAIRYGSLIISTIFNGVKKISTDVVQSVFNMGYWINNTFWDNNDGWKNG